MDLPITGGGALAYTVPREGDGPEIAAYRQRLTAWLDDWYRQAQKVLRAGQQEAADRRAAESEDGLAQMLLAKSDRELMGSTEFSRSLLNTAARERAQVLTGEMWTEPTPLVSNRGLPPFPVETMPSVLRNIVSEIAVSTQVAADLPAVIAVATVCGSLVGRVTVQVDPGWRERVTMYALGLAESGTRKTAVMGRMTAPLYAAQAELQERLSGERRAALRKRDVAKARVDAAKRQAVKVGTDAAWDAVERAQEALDEVDVPHVPVLVTNDATPEALAVTMQDNGERITVCDTEGVGLLTMAGARYGTQSYIDLLLKAHVGEPTAQLRIGRVPTTLQHPVLTIAVLSQPETLQELLGVQGASGRGLLARFLIAAPPDTLGYREIHTPPVSAESTLAYAGLLRSFIERLWTESEPQTVTLALDAYHRIKRYQADCEVRFRPGGDLEVVKDFGGKLVGQAARLSAVHHLATHGGAGLSLPVGLPAVEWAVAAAEWSLAHYTYAVGAAGLVADLADAERVLHWLQRRTGDRPRLSERDFQTGTRLPAERVSRALDILREHGWVRPFTLPRAAPRGRGRPPGPQWELHPSLAGDAADGGDDQ